MTTLTAPGTLSATVAERLDEVARLLEEQGANPFRAQAYHRGADTLPRLARPVTELLREQGTAGLEALPGVGATLARAIRDLVVTGRLPMLDRLRGESDPVALLRTVTGIGRTLAERLHDELGIGLPRRPGDRGARWAAPDVCRHR